MDGKRKCTGKESGLTSVSVLGQLEVSTNGKLEEMGAPQVWG